MTEHQAVLYAMLREVDRLCRKHGISYQLYAGTALGAVRHGGFIPWDDDLDLIFSRKDYLRFCRAAEEELDGRYFLQREYSEHWPVWHGKLRANGTACLEGDFPRDPQTHQGIWADLFVYENLSDRWPVRWLQFCASKVVIAKGLYRRGYRTESLFKKGILHLCRLLPLGSFLALCRMEGREDTRFVHGFLAGGSRYSACVFPREWLEETVRVPFENGEFPVSYHSHALLTALYGDYTRIPTPEEQEKKRHAVLVDTGCSWEKYRERQQAGEFWKQKEGRGR